MNDVEYIDDLDRASALMHPLRLDILDRARVPASAATIASALDQPRQKVNYHVRELARAKLLRKAGTRKKRNMVEQRYVATARSYVLAPGLLGPLQADAAAVQDTLSAAHLIALASRMQADLSAVTRAAAAEERRVATLSISTDLRFKSARQRAGFASALRDAIATVVAEHASPASAGKGRPFRLTLGCYPIPKEGDQ